MAKGELKNQGSLPREEQPSPRRKKAPATKGTNCTARPASIEYRVVSVTLNGSKAAIIARLLNLPVVSAATE